MSPTRPSQLVTSCVYLLQWRTILQWGWGDQDGRRHSSPRPLSCPPPLPTPSSWLPVFSISSSEEPHYNGAEVIRMGKDIPHPPSCPPPLPVSHQLCLSPPVKNHTTLGLRWSGWEKILLIPPPPCAPTPPSWSSVFSISSSEEPYYNGAEVIRMGEDVLAGLAGSGNMFVFKTRNFWTAIKSAA